ncbi:putative amino acid transporter, transmembrane domain-containing protein [Helianthus annuus]|nr:putative amino acid transporter, transmembrane domain-containing protein [Helianthus annuus]KAJ0902814.1 putative amino acid transporter, transmembrane domain-containing protein [Helianthus annuus]
MRFILHLCCFVLTSFSYSSIGLGIGFAQVIENGKIAGSVTGVPTISDTVKSPPAENSFTKRASAIAMVVTAIFYHGCGCFGYAAFGNDTPGNHLTGFGFYEPYWLIGFANACILIYLLGGYQFPNIEFLERFHELKLPLLPVFRFNMFRLCFRTTYIATTTAIALLFPFFNETLGVLGALNLWPLSLYFPVEMYIVQRKVKPWSRKG